VSEKVSVKAFLRETFYSLDHAGAFWNELIEFIDESLANYYKELQSMGLNLSLLKGIHKNSQDESVRDKLKQIGELLNTLSQLHAQFKSKETRIATLEHELQKLKHQIARYEQEQEQFKSLKKNLEHELETKPAQIKKQLSQELEYLRARIRSIPSFVGQAEAEGETIPDSLKRKINTNIQQMVDVLVDQGLWPEPEEKPTLLDVEEPKPRKRRSSKKETPQETIVEQEVVDITEKQPQEILSNEGPKEAKTLNVEKEEQNISDYKEKQTNFEELTLFNLEDESKES
jgi:exonuclease VII large subunit